MTKDAEFVVQIIAKSVLENEQYFSELDGVVGDADFGYSIARGFEKVLQEWDNLDHSLPGNDVQHAAAFRGEIIRVGVGEQHRAVDVESAS